IKSFAVESKQAVSLTATSTDGLITIGQSFIQDKTRPEFKPDGSNVSYKMGFSNGFYYLYIKGGITGSLSFAEKTSQQVVTKKLDIATLKQYNIEVTKVNGVLQINFAPFKYNQVVVNSSTLVTINIDPIDYYFNHSASAYFVATDDAGKVLNAVKYVKGTTTFKFSATEPYDKDRFNFYVIINPDDPNSKPNVAGYLQVKKGSIYRDFGFGLPQDNLAPFAPHIKNFGTFDNLLISTNAYGVIGQSPADSVNFTPNLFIDNGSPLYVQMLKNNKYTYNFFDIPKGTLNFNVDLSKVTKTPLMKTVTGPAGFALNVMAKKDKNIFNAYTLHLGSTQTGSMDVYYPKESFQEYETIAGYGTNLLSYEILTSGPTIPDHVDTYDIAFTVTGKTLGTFVPSITGDYSYYHAYFENTAGPALLVQLYSPSAANYMHAKIPNLSKYLGAEINLADQKLTEFQLIQVKDFDETKFKYFSADDIRAAPGLNVKMVSGVIQ
ncbi:MAG TPA: hypothetical protein VIM55_19500, partial [Mucilaginibacter sp.]